MDNAKTVHTTMWLMIFLQTIGSVDMPGQGARKMPSPRSYVSIIVLWTILGIWADSTNSRGPARFSWLLVISGMVLGPFGTRAVNFLKSISGTFGVTTAPTTSSVPAPPPSSVRPRTPSKPPVNI